MRACVRGCVCVRVCVPAMRQIIRRGYICYVDNKNGEDVIFADKVALCFQARLVQQEQKLRQERQRLIEERQRHLLACNDI